MRSAGLWVLASLLPAPLSAQAGHSGAFVTTLGKDTVSIERFTRTPRRLEGDILIANPRAIHTHYVVDFDEQQNTLLLTVKAWVVGTSGPPALDRVGLVRDSLVINRVLRFGRVDTLATADIAVPPGVLPFISSSTAIYEEVIQRYLRSKADSLVQTLFVFGPAATGAPALVVKPYKGDTIQIGSPPQLLQVDRIGRVLMTDARMTTVRTITRRVADADIARLETAFASRGVVGILSPRDTVMADIGNAQVWLDYGQPRARGRRVFGGLVPFGEVWRTGANAATQFQTNVDLQFGQVTVPAGKYTLWTIPTADGATLIVNKQSGQWGTQYDSTQDLARIPIRTRRLPEAVEQFVIRVEPGRAGAGAIIFAWENLEMIAEFVVRRE